MTEIFHQMVSAPDHPCEIASCIVRSTSTPVISLHLSYISYRQLANGPIRAASGAIVCWRSSLLFMYNVKRTPVVLSSATLNYIALHCNALRLVAVQCITLDYIALHCRTWDDVNLNCIERSVTSQKFKFLKLWDWKHVQRKKDEKSSLAKNQAVSDNCWFSLDVTKIETK